MNIDKALWYLKVIKATGHYDGDSQDLDAINLSIEALQQTLMLRRNGHLPPGAKLPGETVEEEQPK